MPTTRAAKKALKQTVKKTERNLIVKTRVDFLMRKLKKAMADKNMEEGEKIYHDLQKAIDKAAKRNIYHPGKASRIKARLRKKINTLKKK